MKPQGISDENSEFTGRPKKLGELLLDLKAINRKQLSVALKEQKRLNQGSKRKFKLGEILLFLKYIPMNQLHATLLKQHPRSAEDTAKLVKLRDISDRSLDKWLEKAKDASESPQKEGKGIFGSLKGLIR